MGFTLTLMVGAALLAAWLDVRLANLRPKTPTRSLTHALISVLALIGQAGLLGLIYGIPQIAFLAVVLGVFLPALVYALLAGWWMMRALAELTGFAGR
jgi:uncharacterized membrane protein